MKRKLQTLFVAITLIFSCNVTLAQLPNGSLGKDFTLQDYLGNNHTLYNYLDSGKAVILDFFAIW